jgi:hypothetical protein
MPDTHLTLHTSVISECVVFRSALLAASANINIYASTMYHCAFYDSSTHQQGKRGSVHLPKHKTQHNTHLAMLHSSDFMVQLMKLGMYKQCVFECTYTKQLKTKVPLHSLNKNYNSCSNHICSTSLFSSILCCCLLILILRQYINC